MSDPGPPAIDATALGAELARSVMGRFGEPGERTTGFAAAMALPVDRLQDELAYLTVVTMHFCIGAAIGDASARARVAAAFHGTLWSSAPWRATEDGLQARVLDYETAFNNPHPQMGRAYGVGRAFARWCGAAHDVPVIEYGARAYMEQLQPILELLNGVRVV
jgi:hypothetical protein